MDPINTARSNSIGLALRRSALKWRDRIAFAFLDRNWTYRELDTAADRVAAWFLNDLGLASGDRVAVYGRNSDGYLLAWLGCVRAGLVHVPINYALTGPELTYIINQSGARALLVAPVLDDNVKAVRSDLGASIYAPISGSEGAVLEVALSSTTPPATDLPLKDSDLAQIMYTSGTTSHPKGAMMSHGAMMAQYQSCICELDYAAADRSLAALPLYHTAQLHAFSMPQLLVGAYSRLIEAPAPDLVLKIIEEERITSFFAPPTVWISLLRHADFSKRDLSTLTNIYYGASIMPGPVLEELRTRLPQAGLYNVYGQTEIAPVATVLRPEEHAERPNSAGRPVLNVQTRIVDPDMNDVPVGERGEIVHRSPQLLSGYWDKPDETAEAFTGGWFHSGDVGHMDDEGYIYIVDRMKDVINTGGVLVASREVEEALFTHPAVSEVAVIGVPDDKWIEAISAVVVLRDGESATEADIIAHAREHLAPFKVPKSVSFIEALPKNASGKILKRELRQADDG
jgi:fatty-acyl-CoA synthase